MYTSRTYELEIDAAQRPSKVLVNNTQVSDWTYGDDHKVRVNVHQKDVKQKAVVTVL